MRRSSSGLFACLPLVLGLVACVSKPNLGSQIFAIDPPPIASKTLASGARVVSVDRVEVAPEVAGRSLTYRVGLHSFERDPYAVLAASPRELVLALLRTTLDNADFVQDVVEPGGPIAPDVLVEAYVSALEGDFTASEKPVAVVGLELTVMAINSPPESIATLLRKTYVRRLPLSEKTATAVVNAWNQGLNDVVAEFLTDMRAALPPPSPKASGPSR